jgi:hypothetical protein
MSSIQMPPPNRGDRRRLERKQRKRNRKYPIFGMMAHGTSRDHEELARTPEQSADHHMKMMKDLFEKAGANSTPHLITFGPSGSMFILGDPEEHDNATSVAPSQAKVVAWTAAWAKRRNADRYVLGVGAWVMPNALANDRQPRRCILVVVDDREAGLTIKASEVVHDPKTDSIVGFNDHAPIDLGIQKVLFRNLLPAKSVGAELAA